MPEDELIAKIIAGIAEQAAPGALGWYDQVPLLGIFVATIAVFVWVGNKTVGNLLTTRDEAWQKFMMSERESTQKDQAEASRALRETLQESSRALRDSLQELAHAHERIMMNQASVFADSQLRQLTLIEKTLGKPSS